MNTTVSHLGAGICQTVFMNFICHLRQQAIAQTEVGDCACAYSGGWVASGGRWVRQRHRVECFYLLVSSLGSPEIQKEVKKLLSLLVLQGLGAESVGGRSSWSMMFLVMEC